ncbi:hypothetical protein C1645_759465 [Glomus cerebriforme]|uniref:Uncharacterized protein n=1 Tax=Glomus cerebriforme TaxID=658196 RepID=A0A397TBK4_9GLOM|nr:hypothetical protein C1645_759465 [Glomus cerebriforme]
MSRRRVVQRGPWTSNEESRLIAFVNQLGPIGNWPQIASLLGSRNAYQCRKRYRHLVRANTTRRPFLLFPSNNNNFVPPTSLTPRSSRLLINFLLNPDHRMDINFIINSWSGFP